MTERERVVRDLVADLLQDFEHFPKCHKCGRFALYFKPVKERLPAAEARRLGVRDHSVRRDYCGDHVPANVREYANHRRILLAERLLTIDAKPIRLRKKKAPSAWSRLRLLSRFRNRTRSCRLPGSRSACNCPCIPHPSSSHQARTTCTNSFRVGSHRRASPQRPPR